MRPLVAHCLLGLGELYRLRGEREHAQEHHAAAVRMYQKWACGIGWRKPSDVVEAPLA